MKTHENTKTKQTAVSLCQMNNHPDFRLQQAKANFFSQSATKSPAKKSTITIENPVRSSDRTSSGALAEDRLRLARRKAVENINIMNQQKSTTALRIPVPKWKTSIYNKKRYSKVVQQHGVDVSPSENSVVPNDGTSSGALAADRLRTARRKAVENLAKPLEKDGTSEEAQSAPHIKNKFIDTSINTTSNRTEEQLLDTRTIENPVRSSDGPSSGATAADRLRMARRKALASIKIPLSQDPQTSKTQSAETAKEFIDTSAVREHGLNFVVIENKVKANDGISSGAQAADRLRMARRKALESLKK